MPTISWNISIRGEICPLRYRLLHPLRYLSLIHILSGLEISGGQIYELVRQFMYGIYS